MALSLESRKSVLVALLLLALANVSVMMMRNVDADIWLYQVRIDCFSQQFWQGDIYPRWCLSANAGMGSSVFLFYFPLPFYIAALFYPLTYIGVGADQFFTLLCFLATFCTAAACYAWLRDFVSPGVALLATGLMLFVPYRLEVMYFRGAYAEVWSLVWLPLIFKYARRMAKGERALVPLSLLFGLSLLTHVPATATAMLFTGVYLLMTTGKNWQPRLRFAAAAAWGVALALFYLAPGAYYEQFLAKVKLVEGFYGWANGFLSFSYLFMPGLERPVIAVCLTVLWLGALIPPVLNKRGLVADAFARREILAWSVLGLLALFMLLPVSKPVYTLMGPLSKVVFPWRMQLILVLAIAYMLAVRMQWMFSSGRRKTWKLDYGLALFFLWLFAHMLVVSYGPTAELLNSHIRSAQIIFSSEYRSRWTDEEHWDYAYLLKRHDNPGAYPRASVIAGKGDVDIMGWGWDGIVLKTHATRGFTVRLHQAYFPVWKAAMDKTTPLAIRPQEKTGQMLLDIPGGDHEVALGYSIANAEPMLAFSRWASLIAFAGLLAGAGLSCRRRGVS